ncbi:TatD family hydrolase [Isoalcanivorax indicus]|uniref:TatD family hydrolase n=1 Tax=Isoalcanivorax indicus TaxID=2202653 RepID=UPI001B882D8A|nr:TatD family hydrolase [Isoalcanivorax indicus]
MRAHDPILDDNATPMPLMDIGVNLTDKRFAGDLDAVLERAHAAGVQQQLVTGTSLVSSEAALALAQAHPGLSATVGIHPHHASDCDQPALSALAELATHPQVRAIGETGLDFNRDFSPRPQQEKAFAEQLALACQLGKPVFLHQRDAHDRFLPILRDHRDRLTNVVVHCFTDNRRALFDYLDMDCHIGITGWICDERRGGDLRALVPNIPAARLLVETDCPYLLPRDLPEKPPVRGRNEPALLPWIVRALASCRDESAIDVARCTWANSLRLFSPSGNT